MQYDRRKGKLDIEDDNIDFGEPTPYSFSYIKQSARKILLANRHHSNNNNNNDHNDNNTDGSDDDDDEALDNLSVDYDIDVDIDDDGDVDDLYVSRDEDDEEKGGGTNVLPEVRY